jgi:hypothetical protein
VIVHLLAPPFPPVSKDRTKSLLSIVLRETKLIRSEQKIGLYVHNAGEHLYLPTTPPTSYRDFGPTEFTASAHYILAASLSSIVPGCVLALNYVDEIHGLAHAFARASMDLRAKRIENAIITGALLTYPFESDLSSADEIVFAIELDSAAEAEEQSVQLSTSSDRRDVRRKVMELAGRVP